MSNWFKKESQVPLPPENPGEPEPDLAGAGGDVRYSATISVSVIVQSHPDDMLEYQRALDALYSTLHEGDASPQDGSIASVKMNYMGDLSKGQ